MSLLQNCVSGQGRWFSVWQAPRPNGPPTWVVFLRMGVEEHRGFAGRALENECMTCVLSWRRAGLNRPGGAARKEPVRVWVGL